MSPKRAPARQTSHRIRSLEVAGPDAFLNGVKLEFSPHLNCIIGGPGTGKTTAVQLLRWALEDATSPRSDRKELLDLVKGTLCPTGTVRVAIETREGLRYIVKRDGSPSAKPEVLDENGQAAGVSLAGGALFDFEVYGQAEILDIALSPERQLEVIDRLVGPELKQVQDKLTAVESQLASNAREILALHGKQVDTEEPVKELPGLKAKLLAVETARLAESGREVSAELGAKAERDRELAAHDRLLAHLERTKSELVRAQEEIARDAADLPMALKGKNESSHEAARQALTALQIDIKKTLDGLTGRVEATHAEAAAARQRLLGAHVQQEARYLEVISRHELLQGTAQEQLQLQRRIRELEEETRARAERGRRLDALVLQRSALVGELAEQRRKRFELRKQQADRLTQALKPGIRVTIAQASDHRAYTDLISKALKGAPRSGGSIVDKLAGNLLPGQLFRIVNEGATSELIARGLTENRAGWVVEHLKGTPTIYEIETVELVDVPSIELWDGAYKPTKLLSRGQCCTAILPLILMDGHKPILIDQPEDHLDGKFLVREVVQQIRRIKTHRQLLLVTHNPNIPVVGEAERVFVLESRDGKRAELAPRAGWGTVDEVREHVEAILEGGAEAFEIRRKLYDR